MKVFLDVNILIYAAGAPHPHKDPATRLLRRVSDGDVEAVIDAEILQELLYRYFRVQRLEEGCALVDQAVRLLPSVLPVEKSDVVLARQLLAEHRQLEPRDAVHAAIMLHHGLTRIYTYDRHFDLVPGLERLTP